MLPYLCTLHSGLFGAGKDTRSDQQDTAARTYVIDIMEESGPTLVKECYWDFVAGVTCGGYGVPLAQTDHSGRPQSPLG